MARQKASKDRLDQRERAKETLKALVNSRNYAQAAKSLGISRHTLYWRIDRYNLREKLAKIPEKAAISLQQHTVEAAEVLAKQLHSDDEPVAQRAATEILDRAGLVKPEAGATVNVNFNKFMEKERDEFGL